MKEIDSQSRPLLYPPVCLPSSWMFQSTQNSTCPKWKLVPLPVFPSSVMASSPTQLCKPAAWSQIIISWRAGTWACLIFCCIFKAYNSAGNRVGFNYCLQSVNCIHFPPPPPLLLNPPPITSHWTCCSSPPIYLPWPLSSTLPSDLLKTQIWS